MRSIKEHAEFSKLTRLSEKLHIRALIDQKLYPLYKDDLTQTRQYPEVLARVIGLQDTYQQAIAAVYEAGGQLPLVAQLIYAGELPFQIDKVSYLVFAEGVVVHFECQEWEADFEGTY